MAKRRTERMLNRSHPLKANESLHTRRMTIATSAPTIAHFLERTEAAIDRGGSSEQMEFMWAQRKTLKRLLERRRDQDTEVPA